ncbi:MAG: hypothetical protein KC502_21180 [Myxococcales bacterium]|nr:hypothetical protein [Myxococcales bacterium]
MTLNPQTEIERFVAKNGNCLLVSVVEYSDGLSGSESLPIVCLDIETCGVGVAWVTAGLSIHPRLARSAT